MNGALGYALRLVLRNGRRTGTYLFGLTLAVGLFSAILFFVDASSARMTQAAVAPVTVDLQARSTVGAQDLGAVAAVMARDPLVRWVEQLRTLQFSGAAAPGGNAAPGGTVFILDPSFLTSFPSLRLAAGAFDPQGVMLSQSMVQTLGLHLGDTVALSFDQLATPLAVRVTGVVDPSRASYLFISTDPAHAGEVVVVPNDVFMAPALWQQHLAAPLAHPTGSVRAGVGPQLAGAQLFLALHHAALPGDPALAKLAVHNLRLRLAKGFPGQLAFTNSIGDALTKAGSDALWAKLLLLFLGMPGVVLSAYLAKYASDLLTAPQRREIALLRTRGAGPRQILTINALASLLIAATSTVLGLLLGVLATVLLFGLPALRTTPLPALAGSAGIALVAGLALASLATYLPLRRSLQREIRGERSAAVRGGRRPVWARAYLDLLCLAIAALIFWVTARGGGFRPLESAEGASLSLGFFVFLGPLFTWIGATLLLSRVMSGGVARTSRASSALLGALLGDIGEMAGRTIVRRAAQVAGAIVIVALALSFGVSLAIFTSTYHAQKAVDARYALGADLQVVPTASTPITTAFVTDLAGVPGVQAVTPILQTKAVVGASRQAIYGVEPPSLAQVGDFPPGSFAGTTRDTALSALQATPDGVLISAALAANYDVHVDDPVLFQVTNVQTHLPVQVRTKAVGILRHFPSSSHDNFLVVNLAYLAQATHDPSVTEFLATTSAGPGAVATQIRDQYGKRLALQVQDIDTAIVAAGTSLTSLNVDGLARLEGVYTLVIASLGLAIFLLAMLGERRREFGTMLALGATQRQVGRFLWAEALTIGLLAVIIGSAIGLLLGRLFVLLLTVLFTVAPAGVVLPWAELGLLLGLSIFGMIIATLLVGSRLRRLDVAQALREL